MAIRFHMPVQLYTGKGCIEQHASVFKNYGDCCLIVTGKSSARKSGALEDITAVLKAEGIRHAVFDGISQNPTVVSCMEAGKQAHALGASFILGIGGGSPLDAAKAVSVFAVNPGLDEDTFYSLQWPNDPLPILLAGTTAGTGSEVTNVAVLTDSKSRKHSIHDPRMFASVAFGDPSHTLSLPVSVTLSTGVDILAHAAESFFSKKADTLSRAFAVRSISLMYEPLFKAAEGETLSFEEREMLYEASILGGLAISVTGTCFPHNVGYFLTENYQIPHGFACAVFLPELIRHAEKEDPAYAELFFRSCGISEGQFLDLIKKTVPSLPVQLTEDGIRSVLPRWENNRSVKNTIGTVEISEIENCLKQFI